MQLVSVYERNHTFNWKVICPVDSSLSTFLTNQPCCFKINKIEIKTETIHRLTIDDFTVAYSVTWPLYGSEAGGDLVLIQTSLLLLCKSSCSYANWVHLHDKNIEVCIKTRSPPASLLHKGQVIACNQASLYFRGGKVRRIQLLDHLSVASPESGLFSDWSRNKRYLELSH